MGFGIISDPAQRARANSVAGNLVTAGIAAIPVIGTVAAGIMGAVGIKPFGSGMYNPELAALGTKATQLGAAGGNALSGSVGRINVGIAAVQAVRDPLYADEAIAQGGVQAAAARRLLVGFEDLSPEGQREYLASQGAGAAPAVEPPASEGAVVAQKAGVAVASSVVGYAVGGPLGAGIAAVAAHFLTKGK